MLRLKQPVLDSYALLVFLFGQRGADKVEALLERLPESGVKACITAPNWAEVRYIVERKVGDHGWPEVRDRLLGLPIEVVAADQELAEAAGALKAKHKLSLADAFAAALAMRLGADVYTGDPEFRAVEKLVKIVWL